MSRYGWRPDLPDFRDHIFKRALPGTALPPSVDMRSGCPRIYDQGQLGSCTANAIAGAIQFDEIKQKGYRAVMKPSRLFIYYNERDMEGTPDEDSGAYIRDGIKSVATTGICPDRYWPYDQAKFAVRPSATAYSKAVVHKAVAYARVPQDLDSMKACLAEGLPFVFGFTVYESFESPEVELTGVVPMPDPSESVIGGHAVMACGYSDESQRFIVRNSWGTGWGQFGYFEFPYEYLANSDLCDDLWRINVVT